MFILLAGQVWCANHYLISSGLMANLIQSYTRLDEEFLLPDNANRNRQQLALLYERIYGGPQAVVESEAARTVLGLTFAILINIICITVELQLLHEQRGTGG